MAGWAAAAQGADVAALRYWLGAQGDLPLAGRGGTGTRVHAGRAGRPWLAAAHHGMSRASRHGPHLTGAPAAAPLQ